jgi:hypothetical protein
MAHAEDETGIMAEAPRKNRKLPAVGMPRAAFQVMP